MLDVRIENFTNWFVEEERLELVALRAVNVLQMLALVLAHRLVPRYSDAQIFLDLKGASSEPVSSTDAMTADFSHIPHEVLGRISSRIINEVKGINRVVYDISSKPPATIEWE